MNLRCISPEAVLCTVMYGVVEMNGPKCEIFVMITTGCSVESKRGLQERTCTQNVEKIYCHG